MINPRTLSLSFSAGVLGGLVCSLAIWFSGAIGIAEHFGVAIRPQLTLDWLYPRLIWHGLWGLLFCLPIMDRWGFYIRGLCLSLFPSAFQLFVVFPIFQNQGLFGMDLGDWTPFFVLTFNAIWGVFAGWWLKLSS